MMLIKTRIIIVIMVIKKWYLSGQPTEFHIHTNSKAQNVRTQMLRVEANTTEL